MSGTSRDLGELGKLPAEEHPPACRLCSAPAQISSSPARAAAEAFDSRLLSLCRVRDPTEQSQGFLGMVGVGSVARPGCRKDSPFDARLKIPILLGFLWLLLLRHIVSLSFSKRKGGIGSRVSTLDTGAGNIFSCWGQHSCTATLGNPWHKPDARCRFNSRVF